MRRALVLMHRWAGLGTALFLAIAALTGSALAYRDALEEWINPQMFIAHAPGGPTDTVIDALVLRDTVEKTFPQAFAGHVSFARADRTAMFYLFPRTDPVTGRAGPMPVDQVFMNPYTGEIAGSRKWGALFAEGEFQRANIVPFIWRLHEALALPHPWGKWFVGVVALVWTVDCLVGLALTWPRGRPFWAKWLPAWRIKYPSSPYRVNLDIHRAASLWVWLALAVFAWSSVMLNLREAVYRPVMALAFDFSDAKLPRLAVPLLSPRLDWQAARAAGQRALAQASQARGGTVTREESLWYRPALGAYLYRAETSLDVRAHGGAAQAWIDGDTGKVIRLHFPGDAPAGDMVSEWLQALHVAEVGGSAYRFFVAVLGVLIAVLCVTGVVIWWHKRLARRAGASRIGH